MRLISCTMVGFLAIAGCNRKEEASRDGSPRVEFQSKASTNGASSKDQEPPALIVDPEEELLSRIRPLVKDRNLEEAVALACSVATGGDKFVLLSEIARQACRETLDDLPNILGYIRDRDLRMQLLQSTIDWWSARDPDYVFGFADKMAGADRNAVKKVAAESVLSKRNFEVANRLITKMPYSAERTEVLGRFAETIGREDFANALVWYDGIELTEDRLCAFRELSNAAESKGNLAGLVELIPKAEDRQLRDRAVSAAAWVYVQTEGRDHVAEWISNLPEDTKDVAWDRVVRTMGGVHPEDGAPVIQQITDPHLRSQAASTFGMLTCEQDPKRGAAWALTAPEDIQAAAIEGVVYRWFDLDSIAVSDWINELPSGDQRDIALGELCSRLVTSDPASARQVASQIKDGARREAALRRLR